MSGFNFYDDVYREAEHDYWNQREADYFDAFANDYDHDYEDDPQYRALYMQPNPGDVDALLAIVDRVTNIGERYVNNLPTFYVPFTNVTWDSEDIPF